MSEIPRQARNGELFGKLRSLLPDCLIFTFNGVGTILYGKHSPAPDGSYVATKWFVVLFVPIIPLASYRVWQGETQFRFLGTNPDYRLEPLPLQ